MNFLERIAILFGFGFALSGCANYADIRPVERETLATYKAFQETQPTQEIQGPPLPPQPSQPYFETLEEQLIAFDADYTSVPKSPLPRAMWLQEHMPEIMEHAENLISLIGNYTGLEVDVDSFLGSSFSASLLFGHRRYFQKILSDTNRLNGISLPVLLEISGRDFDPHINSSHYSSSVSHQNRADVLADLYVIGIGQKIMQSHHYDIGRTIVEERLSHAQLSIFLPENPSAPNVFLQPMLLCALLNSNPDDVLSVWKEFRDYEEIEFYDKIKPLALHVNYPIARERILGE